MGNKPKGYQILEPEELYKIPFDSFHFEFLVAVLSWLIPELYQELPDELKSIEIEIIKVIHHSPYNQYPALGIHSEDIKIHFLDERYNLIEAICNRLLKEKSVSDLMTYILSADIDWKVETKKIMED